MTDLLAALLDWERHPGRERTAWACVDAWRHTADELGVDPIVLRQRYAAARRAGCAPIDALRQLGLEVAQ